MAQQIILTPTLVNSVLDRGDLLRVALTKTNANFTELFSFIGTKSQANGLAALDSSGLLTSAQRPIYDWTSSLIANKPTSISFSGDASGTVTLGSGALTFPLTLANTGVSPGVYNTITVDAKGRVTNGVSNSYLSANQTITLAGDVSGSGATSITTTLANSGVTPGTYNSVAVDAKGRVIAASNVSYAVGVPTLDQVVSAGNSTSQSVTVGDLLVGGNLTINGTTTTVNSTTVTLDDPVLVLGGDTAPTLNDGKDRGVSFRWHDGSVAKLGFFGRKNSGANAGNFVFVPDATNTNEVFTGNLGVIAGYFSGEFNGTFNGTFTGALGGTIAGAYVSKTGDTMTGNLAMTGSLTLGDLSANTPGYLLDGRTTSSTGLVLGRMFNLDASMTSEAGWDAATGYPNAYSTFRVSNGGTVLSPVLVIGNGPGVSATRYESVTHNFATRNDGTLVPPITVVSINTYQMRVLQATPSTSPTTGALTVTGGAGVSGDLYVGGGVYSPGTPIVDTYTSVTTVINNASKAWRFIVDADVSILLDVPADAFVVKTVMVILVGNGTNTATFSASNGGSIIWDMGITASMSSGAGMTSIFNFTRVPGSWNWFAHRSVYET